MRSTRHAVLVGLTSTVLVAGAVVAVQPGPDPTPDQLAVADPEPVAAHVPLVAPEVPDLVLERSSRTAASRSSDRTEAPAVAVTAPDGAQVPEVGTLGFTAQVVAPVVRPEPAPEPVVQTEPVAAPEPVVQTEPVVETEPVVQTAPVAEPVAEPQAEPEPVVEAVVQTAPEPVVQAEPEPVVQAAPQPEPEPVQQTQVQAAPAQQAEPEPVQQTQPVQQAAPAPVGGSVLSIAASYVGYPYVLYGTPPQAFDCSAYTWYVFQQAGISIPRTVAGQKAAVTPVSNPQPGDLVFYNDFYHVGIYAGNGMTYEALNPGSGVRYGPLVSSNVWYGRIG